MTIHLYVAPAGAGKTEACIKRVLAASRGLPLPRVWACLPTRAQVRAFRRRLAAAGGALGVETGTFFDLYREALRSCGRLYAELDETLQLHLLRDVVDRAADDGALRHYLPLQGKPGFVRVLRDLIEDLKRARVEPVRLQQLLRGCGPRLEELAALYAAYQSRLLAEDRMDREGLGWLATLALERNPRCFSPWRLAVVDGFDEFNPTQLAFLAALGAQVGELVITLTYGPRPGRLAQRRFAQALDQLQERLGVTAEPLAEARSHATPVLARLEAGLFEPLVRSADPPGEALQWLEAPNRAVEARAALRWAKERIVRDGIPPGEVALLARNLAAYIPLLLETAAEFGLPLAVAGGSPLAGNPLVAALLDLLSLARRDRASASVLDGRFPLRQTLEALRSPYFSWKQAEVDGEPVGLSDEDADLLEQAAWAAQAIAGPEQWRQALALRASQAAEADEAHDEAPPAETPAPPREAWQGLALRFERFVRRLTPPAEDTVAGYTAFVEGLIGDDGFVAGGLHSDDRSSLQVLANVRDGPPELVERDLEALRRLKAALLGLVRATELVDGSQRVPYERFLDELAGVVSAARYTWDAGQAGAAVCVASVEEARGLSFRAVALLGLSEGEFPRAAPVRVLLRESDRSWLAAQGLELAPPAPGAEFSLFYEAVTRASQRLLLTRPSLDEAGQPWEPSPFWEETLRLFAGHDADACRALVGRMRAADALPLEQAASWPELAAALAQRLRAEEPAAQGVATAVIASPQFGAPWRAVEHGARLLAARLQRVPAGPFEGDCTALASPLAARYAPQRPWSASRLEAYRACPLGFYLGYALALERREPPKAGFDAAQLGRIYHAILEQVYAQAGSELEALLSALPAVAGDVLRRAPEEYGFRPSLLWEQEKARIVEDCANTLRALAGISEGWRPRAFELFFGLGGGTQPVHVPVEGQGEFHLRGVIDRVDINDAGELRLIDYKAGSDSISSGDLLAGRRLQLALYAWAAQRALAGRVASGFYWHVRPAKRSSLTLERFDGGAAQAMRLAAELAWEAIQGVRAGRFEPTPGQPGCRPYCPGAAFCWRYRPARTW